MPSTQEMETRSQEGRPAGPEAVLIFLSGDAADRPGPLANLSSCPPRPWQGP